MTLVSKNWNFNLNAALGAEVAAMASGAFNLVAVAAVTFIDRAYWQVPAAKVAIIAADLKTAMEGLGYNKSSKYELTGAALDLARNWVKKYGTPNGAERNIFWQMICDAKEYNEMLSFVVSAIKADYQADTMSALYKALKGKPVADRAEVTVSEAVKKVLDKATPNEASQGAVAAIGYVSEADRLAAMAVLVDRMNLIELRKAMDLINDRMIKAQEEADAKWAETIALDAAAA